MKSTYLDDWYALQWPQLSVLEDRPFIVGHELHELVKKLPGQI